MRVEECCMIKQCIGANRRKRLPRGCKVLSAEVVSGFGDLS